MTDELWAELGATMRALRKHAGRSLRAVERSSFWGRGTLSQIENGRARPNREQVEWYDAELGGDGLLLAMYVEARTARGAAPRRGPGTATLSGDAFEVVSSVVASGESAEVGAQLTAGWTLRNAGRIPWTGRALARVGAPTALRLISSDPEVPIPPCDPGQTVEVLFKIGVPDAPGTLAAYWHIVDADGRPCFAPPSLLSVTLLAH
ncbi:NBR1-Ig-like domain-containing protein [uncultured Jatrophihabitans sp.]|uniref:NBR1-Ig-like domain-containing protein n=1 Tax=uncultured Jatrophihabitans sp. TaxID=1610747 RepID=UPI0035CA295D